MLGTKVYVKDFVSNSSEDCALGIRQAILYAIHNHIDIIEFEEGTYNLKSTITLSTEGMMHDADSLNYTSKDAYISIMGSSNLTLVGAVDEKGEVKTILAGHNPGEIHSFLPSVLWCENNDRLTIKNIAFTRNPEFSSSGRIIKIEDMKIWIEINQGNHITQEMGTYCMNQFDSEHNLLGESLSYGKGLGTLIYQISDQILFLEHEIAKRLSVGNYISWHQGAKTDFQVYFYECNNLKLENVRTINSNGFAMLAESCHNITSHKVEFRPREGHHFVAPRDAWKLFKCTGCINMDEMYVEGVRMDGQNIQSNWLFVREILSDKKAVFYSKYTKKDITIHSPMEFYDMSAKENREVKSCTVLRKEGIGYLYEIEFTEKMPNYVKEADYCAAQCWEPDQYICCNSKFVNIAGAGHLVRADHVTILNCLYKNTMNSGILLGAEMPVHNEGGHATDVVIRGCTFDNSGFIRRYPTSEASCIGIDSAGFSETANKDIYIINNIFRNSSTAIFIRDAERVYVLGNSYINIANRLQVEDQTTNHIIVEDEYSVY